MTLNPTLSHFMPEVIRLAEFSLGIHGPPNGQPLPNAMSKPMPRRPHSFDANLASSIKRGESSST